MYKRVLSKQLGLLLLVQALLFAHTNAQSTVLSLNSDNAQIVWKVKAQQDVKDDPEKICSQNYPQTDWVKAIVPGTVFASYVAAGLEKDPNFGDNIQKVDKAKYDRNFWYRAEINFPDNFKNEKTYVNFDGINRKADVYFNGKKIGTLDGFMQRGNFDITDLIRKNDKNIVAVLVYWPQPPLGNYASPTYISSAGWDWMPYVPGLNMGITDKVFLQNAGVVMLKDPWIKTNLPSNARADLSLSVEVKNNSQKQQQGVIRGTIQPGNISFSQKISIDANNTDEVKIDYRKFPQLIINNPKLWWPNGYGDPNLYTCKLNVELNGIVSDTKDFSFGIKKYSYDTLGDVLHVFINGTKVFLKGGNWGMSEYMQRCKGSEYDLKVKLHKEMNYNIIRNWIGSTTDEEFYEACDKYGIMIWDDFWLNANPNLPRDINVFNANVIEKIKRRRNHPAVAVWCGDNEGWPEPPLSNWIKEDIRIFDNNERYWQPNSHADNLTGSGFWGNQDPRYYFTAYPKAIGGNKGWGLRTETGTAVFTNFESFKKFMPEDKWWPRNDMWNTHYFGQSAFNATPDYYEECVNKKYGKATGIEDFCRKAQFLNIETNKAMYEGWLDHMWEDASGIMIWMSQSSYPSMIWQTYDYYYDLTGAYWGVKKACEPLHIQWNPATDTIKVVNTTAQNFTGLTAEASVYNMNGKPVAHYNVSKQIESPSNSAVNCFSIPFSHAKNNLALNKKVYVSSTNYGDPSMLTDNDANTRWSSNSTDEEWLYVDLGEVKDVAGVGLNWQDAYAQSFKIFVSTDAVKWKEVYATTEGEPGEKDISFAEEKARYVKVQGLERGTYWGYSLWDMKVYEGNVKSEGLSDVHFIKLKLTNDKGKIFSDNFYWRGNNRKDFTALNTLSKVNLKVTSKTKKDNGKYTISAQISNPASSPCIAFGIRVQAVKGSTGEQILPSIMNDNYFSLMPGESKDIQITFDESAIEKDVPQLKAEAYNGK